MNSSTKDDLRILSMTKHDSFIVLDRLFAVHLLKYILLRNNFTINMMDGPCM